MASKLQYLNLIRHCFKELRYQELTKRVPVEHFLWRKSPIYNYVIATARSGLSEIETEYLESYIIMLHGNRRTQELIAQYRGVGERSIEETARIVGLKLPKLYEDKEDIKL